MLARSRICDRITDFVKGGKIMKICFIDDNLCMTFKVMEAMKNYYEDCHEDAKLDCRMILMDVDDEKVEEGTLIYYKKLLDNLKINFERCEQLSELGQIIEHGCDTNELFLVDLYMIRDENIAMAKDPNYKCISMKCMDELEKRNLRYKWYSAYLESNFKDEWQKRYEMLYRRMTPKIYERNNLVSAYFNESVANEILDLKVDL